jgi:phosphohistidine phosphatase
LKSLIIIRHAKSSWDDSGLDDFERPLNLRGERDAPLMAQRMKRRGVRPQQMLSSPARRALDTCVIFADELSFPSDDIVAEKSIYHAASSTLLEIVRRIREVNNDQPVLLFGHNPGLTDFVNELLDEDIDNIPTAGVVGCTLAIDRWAKTKPGCGKLEFFDYPKRI